MDTTPRRPRKATSHAAPPGHLHPRDEAARRDLVLPARRRLHRPRRRLVPLPLAVPARHGRAGELQRPDGRRRGPRLLRRHLVPAHRSRPARLGRPARSCCTSSRRRIAPPSGSTTTRSCRATRAATRRSRPTCPFVARRRRGPGHGPGQQHPVVPVHPAGRH